MTSELELLIFQKICANCSSLGRKAIDKLHKEILSLMPQWISVEDRLPEYQAYAGDEQFAHVFAACGKLTGQGMYCNGKWEFMGVKDAPVTNWMPLPLPPKEERKERKNAS